jgi:hypothetical protein
MNQYTLDNMPKAVGTSQLFEVPAYMYWLMYALVGLIAVIVVGFSMYMLLSFKREGFGFTLGNVMWLLIVAAAIVGLPAIISMISTQMRAVPVHWLIRADEKGLMVNIGPVFAGTRQKEVADGVPMVLALDYQDIQWHRSVREHIIGPRRDGGRILQDVAIIEYIDLKVKKKAAERMHDALGAAHERLYKLVKDPGEQDFRALAGTPVTSPEPGILRIQWNGHMKPGKEKLESALNRNDVEWNAESVDIPTSDPAELDRTEMVAHIRHLLEINQRDMAEGILVSQYGATGDVMPPLRACLLGEKSPFPEKSASGQNIGTRVPTARQAETVFEKLREDWPFGMAGLVIFVLMFVTPFLFIAGSQVKTTLGTIGKGVASRGWSSTPGVVIDSRIVRISTRWFKSTSEHNEPRVLFRYSVGGREFESKDIEITGNWSGFDIDQFIRDHPMGKTVTAYYNPDQPGEAVLEPGFKSMHVIQILWGVAIAAVVGGLCYFVFFFRLFKI